MNKLHLAIIRQMDGKQLREISRIANEVCGCNCLESTISARIRDMPGLYTTVSRRVNGCLHVKYYANPGAILNVWKRVA